MPALTGFPLRLRAFVLNAIRAQYRFTLESINPESRSPPLAYYAAASPSYFVFGACCSLGSFGICPCYAVKNSMAKSSSRFTTTNWSVVLDVQNGNVELAREALEWLCVRYWRPVYVFIRSRGAVQHEAEDLTQSFFAFLLAKDTLKAVDPDKGRFRTFLLTALTNFLANEYDKRHTAKRGGELNFISLEEMISEEASTLEHCSAVRPENVFERRWATTVIGHVLERLKREYESSGKGPLYETLQVGLTGEVKPGDHAEWAGRLGLAESAVRVALHRLRRRFGELLRSEIAQTVASPEDVDDELRQLFTAIAG